MLIKCFCMFDNDDDDDDADNDDDDDVMCLQNEKKKKKSSISVCSNALDLQGELPKSLNSQVRKSYYENNELICLRSNCEYSNQIFD